MIRIRRLLQGNSRGVTLIEALIAMAIVGIIAVAFLGGLATASRSAALADIRTNAESLARTHLEYAKSQRYSQAPWDYAVTEEDRSDDSENRPEWWTTSPPLLLSPDYAGYTVTVRASEILEGLQEITVIVFHHSRGEEAVITLSGYKVDR